MAQTPPASLERQQNACGGRGYPTFWGASRSRRRSRWLSGPGFQTGVQHGPIRCIICPDDHCRAKTMSFIQNPKANGFQVSARRALTVNLGSAGRAETESQGVAACRLPVGRCQSPNYVHILGLEDRVVGRTASRDLLALSAPALPRGNRLPADFKRYRAASTPAGVGRWQFQAPRRAMNARRSNIITSCSFLRRAPWSGGIALLGS